MTSDSSFVGALEYLAYASVVCLIILYIFENHDGK